ncbi:MAG: hypothetical protein P8M30_13420 [Planctomycetaceae bacterium]|jgi:hypothetical protein|nr:hypothetical protein [Planctomycetaceae bacterium]MDC0273502.1 hypothetical protein [Planctomycetaceae bacterium]MDG2390306.1 hypothetical protein [Planctomycetaceae bacterium]
MKLNVLKKFAALVSVICVSFAAVGCAPPADDAATGGDAPAAGAADEGEGGSATE